MKIRKDKVFCIGFPKTGTTSIEKALEELDYKVCRGHYNNNHTNYLISLFYNQDYKEINRLINYYDAFADLPWGGTDFYLYLSKKYPNAKFIHSIRSADLWYDSLEKMLTKLDSNLKTALSSFHKGGRYGVIYYLEKEFNITQLYGNKKSIINHYNLSNNKISLFFSENNFSYLKIDITNGEGWVKICSFLNENIPTIDFPFENRFSAKTVIKIDKSNVSVFKGLVNKLIK